MSGLRFLICAGLILLMAGINSVKAQDSLRIQAVPTGFIDSDGDGYNDNAPDHDGDGTPNVIDPDWQALQSGKKKKNNDYIDLNGNGINDYIEFAQETYDANTTHQNRNMKDESDQGQGMDQSDDAGSHRKNQQIKQGNKHGGKN